MYAQPAMLCHKGKYLRQASGWPGHRLGRWGKLWLGRGLRRSGELPDCLPWGRQKFVALVCIVSAFQAYAKVKIATGAPGNFIKSARNNNKDHDNNGLKK